MTGQVHENLSASDHGWFVSAASIVGAKVCDAAGRPIGLVRNVLVDHQAGKLSYAIVNFLWAEHDVHYALPWRLMQYDFFFGGYVLRVPRLILADAPRYVGPNSGFRSDWAWSRKVDEYFRSWL